MGDREGIRDFTFLGDATNTAARLAYAAGAGEVLVSEATSEAAVLQGAYLEARELTLRGKSEPEKVSVIRVDWN